MMKHLLSVLSRDDRPGAGGQTGASRTGCGTGAVRVMIG
jgi:hypothetical protein